VKEKRENERNEEAKGNVVIIGEIHLRKEDIEKNVTATGEVAEIVMIEDTMIEAQIEKTEGTEIEAQIEMTKGTKTVPRGTKRVPTKRRRTT